MRNKKRFIYLFVLGISSCLIISMILLIKAPNPLNLSKKNLSLDYFDHFDQVYDNFSINTELSKNKNHNSKMDEFETNLIEEDNDVTRYIRSLIHNSYLSYSLKCASSDFFQPISGGCLNSSGLSLTAIESLEGLYLSGLSEDFKISVDYVSNNFTCSSSKFQNFYEMGTKILGGLIGIYSLMKNYMFIEKAVECANVMKYSFKSSIPHPILDGIKHQPKKYSFIDGNLLSESSGFILEFSALSRITGDVSYENYVQNYLKCILSIIKSTNSLPTTVSVDKCQSSKKISIFKKKNEKNNKYNDLHEYAISFIANVIRLHLYSPSSLTADIIDFINDFLSVNNGNFKSYIFDSSFCQLNYLMGKIPKLNSSQFHQNLNSLCQSISRYDFPVLKSDISSFPNLKVINDGFYFDFIPLIDTNISEKSSQQLKYLNLLNITQCKTAQCALISQDPVVHDDLMPAELFSKWLKFLYLANSSIFDFSKKDWIINEAGHLIASNNL